MKYFFTTILLELLTCSFIAPPITVNMAELQPYLCKWKGTLGYSDYSTGRWTTIPAAIEFRAINKTDLLVKYIYPGEESHNSTDTAIISANGRSIDGGRIIKKTKTNGQLKLILEKQGLDSEKNALFRITYLFTQRKLTIKKEVRFIGEKNFFTRNEYRLTK